MSINLKTRDADSNKEKIQFGKTLPVVILLLALVLVAYGALFFFQKRVEAQIASEQEMLNSKTQEFKNGDAKNVLDFQNRISESGKLLDQYVDNLVLLDEIQRDVLPGVFLTDLSFNLEDGEVNLDCRASNYEQVSKQILSFKKSSFFSKVEAGKTSIMAQEGLIGFEVILVPAKQENN